MNIINIEYHNKQSFTSTNSILREIKFYTFLNMLDYCYCYIIVAKWLGISYLIELPSLIGYLIRKFDLDNLHIAQWFQIFLSNIIINIQ